ncbi:MAG: class I SAM-dependent methyltransferase [Chloroflexota bacterium]
MTGSDAASPMPADPGAKLKRGMRGSYDQAAGRYQQYIMPVFEPIARRVVYLARPNTDDVHIDLATGTGLVPAMTDDRRTMSCITPWRAAMDLSANMLRQARVNSPPTRLLQGDLELLPIRTGSVDVVTLSLALHHLPTPRRALAEMRRILSPRGRLVLAAWGNEMSPLWQAFDRWFEGAGLGAARAVSVQDLPIDTPDLLRTALLEVGGFGSAEVIPETPPMVFPSLADFWEWRISFPAPNRTFSAMTPERRAALREDCLAMLRELTGDGEVRADQTVLFAIARP